MAVLDNFSCVVVASHFASVLEWADCAKFQLMGDKLGRVGGF